MIRNFQPSDLDTLVRIANDFTVRYPEWYSGELPPDNRPFTNDKVNKPTNSWCFVYEENGQIVGFTTGVISGGRGEFDIIVVDPKQTPRNRISKFWELMREAGIYCQSQGCTYMHGVVAPNYTQMLDMISDWSAYRISYEDVFGLVYCGPPIELFLSTCEAKLGN